MDFGGEAAIYVDFTVSLRLCFTVAYDRERGHRPFVAFMLAAAKRGVAAVAAATVAAVAVAAAAAAAVHASSQKALLNCLLTSPIDGHKNSPCCFLHWLLLCTTTYIKKSRPT